jgi:hypothetical protein
MTSSSYELFENKLLYNYDLKRSRGQEVKRSRGQEVKRSRGQEICTRDRDLRKSVFGLYSPYQYHTGTGTLG